MKYKALAEFNAPIIAGQILPRVVWKEGDTREIIDTKNVIVPNSFDGFGGIDTDKLKSESFVKTLDEKYFSKPGDLLVKLNAPFEAVLVDEASSGCVVPSYIAIIRCPDTIDRDYLLAFFNSESYAKQLPEKLSLVSVGLVGQVMIPSPDKVIKKEIGDEYKESLRKLKLIKEIQDTETLRNNTKFLELENK